MLIINNELHINDDDFTLNRISVKDFKFDDFRDYMCDICYDRDNDIAEKFSVDWCLLSTDNLIGLADKLRQSKGYLPMIQNDDEQYDMDGWYNFYFVIECTITNSEVTDFCYELWFSVDSDFAVDDGKCYNIELSDSSMNKIVAWLEFYEGIDFNSFVHNKWVEYKE